MEEFHPHNAQLTNNNDVQFPSDYFICPKHPQQSLCFLCTDDKCARRGLICPLCEHEGHKQHSTAIKSLKLIVSAMQQDYRDSQSHVQMAAYIDMKHQNLSQILTNQISDVHIRQVIIASVDQYFQRIKKTIQGEWYHNYRRAIKKGFAQFQYSSGEAISKKQSDFPSTLLLQLQKVLLQYFEWTSFEKLQNKPNFLAKMDLIREEIKDKEKTIIDAIKKKRCDQTLAQVFLAEGGMKKFRFSQTLKHSSIQVLDGKKITLQNHYDTVLGLVEPELKGKRKIKFKACHLPSWTAFGVCFRDIVKDNNFTFPSENHGSFQVSYDGYSWAHKTNQNEVYHGWYFNEQDTVTVEFDPKQEMLTFTRNEEKHAQHKLQYASLAGQKVYFCVSLNSNDESVQIIDE